MAVTAAVALGAAAAPPVALGTPKIAQLVAFKDGTFRQSEVKARKTHVKVGGRKCTVGSATPLSALVLSDAPKVKLHDYGSCGSRARDSASLFVRSIGGEPNKGTDGWVYKVGNRVATAGAADPSGPFGNGRLKSGTRVTWFYCHMNVAKHSCQRTLGLTTEPGQDETLNVHVTAYDDRGKGKPAAHATVRAGDATQTTDKNGDATLVPGPGRFEVSATKTGFVRSFAEVVDIN